MNTNDLTLNEMFRVFGGSKLGVGLSAKPVSLGSICVDVQIKGE